MSSSDSFRRVNRWASFETFESRIALSADSLANAVVQGQLDTDIHLSDQQIQWSLADAHQSTGAQYVFNDYGFDGTGQTVAIIDSGIAWDHYALGGGLGNDYRVVGGWDFAEGDANPYDDGPAGYHGTHVAGIVGSQDQTHRGVASGVDLVGLRVFDDGGRGELQWVEQALQWVHQHQNDFANPITTVNLSLGVEWNADNVPGWATLENEFAQLEADGIFISVAAGNSFQQYGTTGLAYPAVSDHVVPVASHDAAGDLSSFSQRNDRVLVAPGESIRSTIPDHLLAGSQTGNFLGASGTSMAAPYVAGASTVLRQAMDFMGYQDIDQDALYDHFRATANQFHDSVTSGLYHRLDLGAAVDAIVNDLHSGAEASATNIGALDSGDQLSGTIGKLTDADAFRFSVQQSGQMTFTVNQTHELSSLIRIDGNQIQMQGSQFTLDVIAGQQYVLSVSTANGIGHYQIDAEIDHLPVATELGTISAATISNQSVNGSAWYRLNASRDGVLTTQSTATNIELEVYDQSMNLIGTADGNLGRLRSDVWVSEGQEYFLKVSGQSGQFDLTMKNLVGSDGSNLLVSGTNQNDFVTIDAESVNGQVYVTINSTQYNFSTHWISHIQVNALRGGDQLELSLDAGHDEIVMHPNNLYGSNDNFSIAARGFSKMDVHSGGGGDQVTLIDSAGNDHLELFSADAEMYGNGFRSAAHGFESVIGISNSGKDHATIVGSSNNDFVSINDSQTQVRTGVKTAAARGFDSVEIFGGYGNDKLTINGSAQDDLVILSGHTSESRIGNNNYSTRGFENVTATAGQGNDVAQLNDTRGSDEIVARPDETTMSGSGYRNTVRSFESVQAMANQGGFDVAVMYDSSGADQYSADQHTSTLTGGDFSNQVIGFDRVVAIADGGGHDHALFVGSQGNDTMYAHGSSTWIWGDSYRNSMIGFEQTQVMGNGGNDSVRLDGDNQNTHFQVGNSHVELQGNNYRTSVEGFGQVNLDGGGGQNSIALNGFDADDRLTASGSALLAFLDDTTIAATNFIWMEAETDAGQTSEREIDAVDFWYALHGEWQ